MASGTMWISSEMADQVTFKSIIIYHLQGHVTGNCGLLLHLRWPRAQLIATQKKHMQMDKTQANEEKIFANLTAYMHVFSLAAVC